MSSIVFKPGVTFVIARMALLIIEHVATSPLMPPFIIDFKTGFPFISIQSTGPFSAVN